MMLCLVLLLMTMPSLLLQQLDRRSGQHSDRPQMRATPPPSPSTIMTLLATCQSTLSLFPQSPSMRRHSVISLPSHMDLPYQPLLLVPGKHPAMLSTTVPHTGCYLMATALLLYMPMAQDQSVRSTLSLSHVTLYYRRTHMKGLCEYSKLKHGEKTLSKTLSWDQRTTWGDLKWTLSWTVLPRVY